jgi:hypothetical protein
MAKSAGIRVAETRLLEESRDSERRHLLVARFDVPESGLAGQRIKPSQQPQ